MGNQRLDSGIRLTYWPNKHTTFYNRTVCLTAKTFLFIKGSFTFWVLQTERIELVQTRWAQLIVIGPD